MNKILPLIGLVVFQACAQNPWYGDLEYLGKLPSKLSEVSGIIPGKNNTAWIIEDNGNKDRLYRINLKGKLIQELKVKDAGNEDWEDLARAQNGDVFIGDFGNNGNYRKDLVIYKVPNPDTEKGDKIDAEKIEFRYPEQNQFPPKKAGLYYDCEAFFHHGSSLYLITKNRARPYNGRAYIYKVPDTPGKYAAQRVGELVTCTDSQFCSVTAADISPDGTKIVLLGSGFIWLYTDFSMDDFSQGKLETIDVLHRTQQESICFVNDSTLLIADEQSKTKGRNLYSYTLKKD
ncbi:hypothetical protein [Flagellimonas allohymeniacidonis]|uniref:Uncharacterized protein n=1 Tax=Flagellimonas allohymeniacidonis TaxID=2517819 RepID=A0A4Q8QC85_9FLAO|nr:hypothetical protein [Allomuricauda hymeniacidonis]TAI47975.1 hypothetical protein EW142_15095 [Allomuricauda hymeniacidonis]